MIKKILLASCLLLVVSLIAGCTTATSTTTTTTTSSTTTTSGSSFSLTSSAFTDSSSIPPVYAKNGEYAGLDSLGAANTSIPLAWANPPAGTVYYAIKMIDVNNGSAHWLIVNIPSTTTSFAAGASPASITGTEVVNDYTAGQYEGMWPPSGSTHIYTFTIHACSGSVSTAGINNQTTFDAAVAAVSLGSTTLSGSFVW